MDMKVKVTELSRILEWVAIPFSRRSSQPRDWTWVSCTAGGFFTVWATNEAQNSALPLTNHLTLDISLSFDFFTLRIGIILFWKILRLKDTVCKRHSTENYDKFGIHKMLTEWINKLTNGDDRTRDVHRMELESILVYLKTTWPLTEDLT